MKLVKFAAAVAATVLSIAAQAAPTDIVVNGSFEAQFQKKGTWSNPSVLTGWDSDAPDGTRKFELRNDVFGTAQDMNNFVELDTNYNSNIFQTLTGTGSYTLSFYYMDRPGTRSATNGLGFSFGSFTSGPLASASDWKQYTTTINFGEQDSQQQLKFFALGDSDSYGTSLDNITVTAVPEPETYALMLAGLGMMGFIARRRRAG